MDYGFAYAISTASLINLKANPKILNKILTQTLTSNLEKLTTKQLFLSRRAFDQMISGKPTSDKTLVCPQSIRLILELSINLGLFDSSRNSIQWALSILRFCLDLGFIENVNTQKKQKARRRRRERRDKKKKKAPNPFTVWWSRKDTVANT